MDAWMWIVIAVVAIVVLGAVAWYAAQRRKTTSLQETFGPEYERAVEDAPTKREAEAELSERQKRREALEITPLSPTSRERYLRAWEDTQARFVDDPEGAVGQADGLIQEVMRERGYPVEDFDQRATDLSVDHPHVVENYRAAHAISRKTVHGEAETEDLRQAMVHYRALFEEIVETRETAETTR
jgi:hypothetical protein